MKPEEMKVGMLIQHEDASYPGYENPGIWGGSTGIIIKLKRIGIPNDKGEIPLTSFPDILWDDGQIGTAHVQYLSEIENE